MSETGSTPPPVPQSGVSTETAALQRLIQSGATVSVETSSLPPEQQSAPPQQVKGEVVSVDRQARSVTFRTDQGQEITVRVEGRAPINLRIGQEVIFEQRAAQAEQAAQRVEYELTRIEGEIVRASSSRAVSEAAQVATTQPVSDSDQVSPRFPSSSVTPVGQRAVAYETPVFLPTEPEALAKVLQNLVQRVSTSAYQEAHSSQFIKIAQSFLDLKESLTPQSGKPQLPSPDLPLKELIYQLERLRAPLPQLSKTGEAVQSKNILPTLRPVSSAALLAKITPPVIQSLPAQLQPLINSSGVFVEATPDLAALNIGRALSQGAAVPLATSPTGLTDLQIIQILQPGADPTLVASPLKSTPSVDPNLLASRFDPSAAQTRPFIGILLGGAGLEQISLEQLGSKTANIKQPLLILTDSRVLTFAQTPQKLQNLVTLPGTLFSGTIGLSQPIPFTSQESLQQLLSQLTALQSGQAQQSGTIPNPLAAAGQGASLEAQLVSFFEMLGLQQGGETKIAQRWPALEQFFRELAVIDSQLAALTARAVPSAVQPAQLTTTLIFFIAALSGGNIKAWLGQRAINTLIQSGNIQLAETLQKNFSRLSQRSKEPVRGEWRSTPLPMSFGGEEIQVIEMFTRRQRPDEDEEDEDSDVKGVGKITRFIMNVRESRILGDIQIDGLAQPHSLDLILRSELIPDSNLRQGIKQHYHQALEIGNISGTLTFEDANERWVNIREISSSRYN